MDPEGWVTRVPFPLVRFTGTGTLPRGTTSGNDQNGSVPTVVGELGVERHTLGGPQDLQVEKNCGQGPQRSWTCPVLGTKGVRRPIEYTRLEDQNGLRTVMMVR